MIIDYIQYIYVYIYTYTYLPDSLELELLANCNCWTAPLVKPQQRAATRGSSLFFDAWESAHPRGWSTTTGSSIVVGQRHNGLYSLQVPLNAALLGLIGSIENGVQGNGVADCGALLRQRGCRGSSFLSFSAARGQP